MKLTVLLALTAFCFGDLKAQESFYDASHVSKNQKIPYLVSLPEGYQHEANIQHPVIIFLHGGDGSNTKHHPKKYATKNGLHFPFAVVAPKSAGVVWNDVDFEQLLEEVGQQYSIDRTRVYITGYSYGGYGTWSALINYPDLFAAAVPICGGGDTFEICNAKNVAIKAYHAKDDAVTPYSQSVGMVGTLRECGGNATLKTVITGGHGIWPSIYSNKEIYEWFLSQRKAAR